MNPSMNEIPAQVRLPVSVAMEVVLQGIRIRLGRSFVTITGVVCGIAFLMSILTGQIIKSGVKEEDAKRMEIVRMENFLLADAGGLESRPVALAVSGPLDEIETRFLQRQVAGAASRYRVTAADAARLPDALRLLAETVDAGDLLADQAVLFMVGGGGRPLPDALRPAPGTRAVIAALRGKAVDPGWPGIAFVPLARELTAEDVATQEQEARQERFRSLWIVIISLLVTVIGISNAMLMSVTERFREIGTMKCLGSLSAFIRRIFLLESSLMGVVGGTSGALFGMVFAFLVYAFTYGWGLVGTAVMASAGLLGMYFGGSLAAGIVLSVVAALYPAQVASRMVPADALRSNV